MKIIRVTLSHLTNHQLYEIESFLDSNFSTIFHEPDFNRIVEDVFGTKFSYNLAYNQKGKLVALCPLHSQKIGILKNTYSNPSIYEVPYGGWVYDKDEVDFSYLINEMKLSLNESLVYISPPLFEKDEYKKVGKKIKFQTAIVDLMMHEEEIWRNIINQKKRNKIRKAQKSNLLVEKHGQSGIEHYLELMRETYEFAGLKIKPKEYYKKILETYYPRNQAIILLAKKESNILSGNILLRNRHICHYWASARNRLTKNLGQGELLQWESIKWSKENESRYYDLCVVEKDRLPQIAMFKLGFSKDIVHFYYFNNRRISYRIMSKIQRCFIKR